MHDAFNRTAYGIEIQQQPLPSSLCSLLIAPLMELKCANQWTEDVGILLLIAPLMELK